MIFRRMKMIFRKAIIGNLFALSTVVAFILVYVFLLRYNKVNTHFDLRSHEIKKRYIRGEPLQIKVPWKKLLNLNVWKGKEGNWTRRIGPNAPLSVFIVEEHHEVIPYWFDAANAKAIPRQGNTLIHIDGHDDMSLPLHFPDFPLFRWPKTKQDFKLLMQRNDVFIAEAIISGLINRVVWIWPVWDKKNHNSSYEVYKNQIGLAKIRNKKNILHSAFCICQMDPKTFMFSCEYADYERENPTMVPIPKAKCRTQRSYTYEEIREDVAAKHMANTKWLPTKDNVILDIDEDYYGCVYASQPLIDVGIKEVEMEHMNTYLSKLVCPKSLAQEKYADNVFVTALEFYKRFYACQNSKQMDKKKCSSVSKITTEVKSYLQNILEGSKKIHTCSKQRHVIVYAISEIIHSFQKLNEKQIKTLQRVGFCLNTTPKTLKIVMPYVFRVCMGANTPSDSAVLTHSPTKKDIINRTITLQNILTSIKSKSIKFVTICRSSRDGYTPRRHMKFIESNIMGSLNKTFNNNCVSHYDGGLLGGIKGWISRPKVFIKKN